MISVGGTTYYAIYATSGAVSADASNSNKPVTEDEFASVNDVVEVLNAYGKKNATNGVQTVKAFASLDELMSAIKQDLGTDIKTISSYYESNIDTNRTTEDNELDDAEKDELGNALSAGTVLKIETFSDMNDAVDLSLHVGADSSTDNKIGMNIAMMSARALGINGLDVSGDTHDKATAAIDTIAAALQMVSNQRASLGAIQNRLEHTINNLDNVVENTQSAESAIRDTDMATQMVSYSNNQILAQAGQAMLAQSNQANQGVLSLLG